MVTGDPVSRSATAGIPSISMVVVGVGPSTTHTITVGVGLSPCKVTRIWSRTLSSAPSCHCTSPDEGLPLGSLNLAQEWQLCCTAVLCPPLRQFGCRDFGECSVQFLCIHGKCPLHGHVALSSSRCILRWGVSTLWGWDWSSWNWYLCYRDPWSWPPQTGH